MVAGSFIRISRSYVSNLSLLRVSMCFPNDCVDIRSHSSSHKKNNQ